MIDCEKFEIEQTKDRIKNMVDNILDIYKRCPEESKKLLLELNQIDKELDELNVEILKIENEL
jgi:hypothetical protein